MATRTIKDAVKPVKRKTPEMEALLGIGYGGMTVESAKRIVAERDKDPHVHPYERYEAAKAFLAAYETEPIATSLRTGWKRTKTP